VFTRGVSTLSMYRSCVPHSSVSENLRAPLTAFFQTVDNVISEDWRKLLHRERMIATHSVQFTKHRARSFRNGEARHFRDDFRAFPDDLRIERVGRGRHNFR